MTGTARQVFDDADQAFKRGHWRTAIAGFSAVIEACPQHFKPRFRIGDALLNLGRRDLALEVYKSIAWHAIKSGYPLLGLVAVKMVILLEPAYEDILFVLAETYAMESDRVDARRGVAELEPLGEQHAEPGDVDAADLLERAAKVAQFDMSHVDYPASLPAIPLFSHLDEESFGAVLSKLKLRRYADDELIIRQGEQGESFFMVADGDVSIVRDKDDGGGVTLAHLRRGSVFGEKALISTEPRLASAVARGDVDVLEIRRSDLVVAAAELAGVTRALKAFTRERFLSHLTATHPFFTSMTKEQRHEIMDLFEPVTFEANERLVTEGDAGPGIFLLLGGTAEVTKMTAGERVHLAKLRAGDLCGEMSLLHDQPTSATVACEEPLDALFLSRHDFQTTVANHPELVAYLTGITDERLRQNRAVLQAKGLLEDDEHVMI